MRGISIITSYSYPTVFAYIGVPLRLHDIHIHLRKANKVIDLSCDMMCVI